MFEHLCEYDVKEPITFFEGLQEKLSPLYRRRFSWKIW